MIRTPQVHSALREGLIYYRGFFMCEVIFLLVVVFRVFNFSIINRKLCWAIVMFSVYSIVIISSSFQKYLYFILHIFSMLFDYHVFLFKNNNKQIKILMINV